MLRASCATRNRRPSKRKLRLPTLHSVAGLSPRASNDGSVARAVVTSKTFLSQLHCHVTVEGVRNQSRNQRGAYRASRCVIRSPHLAILIPNDNRETRDFIPHLIGCRPASTKQFLPYRAPIMLPLLVGNGLQANGAHGVIHRSCLRIFMNLIRFLRRTHNQPD